MELADRFNQQIIICCRKYSIIGNHRYRRSLTSLITWSYSSLNMWHFFTQKWAYVHHRFYKKFERVRLISMILLCISKIAWNIEYSEAFCIEFERHVTRKACDDVAVENRDPSVANVRLLLK